MLIPNSSSWHQNKFDLNFIELENKWRCPVVVPGIESNLNWIDSNQDIENQNGIKWRNLCQIQVLIPADESKWMNQSCVNQNRIMWKSCSTALWQTETGHFAKERCMVCLKPGQDFAEQSVVRITAFGSHSFVWTALARNDGKKEGHTKQQRCPEDYHRHRASHNRQLTDMLKLCDWQHGIHFLSGLTSTNVFGHVMLYRTLSKNKKTCCIWKCDC